MIRSRTVLLLMTLAAGLLAVPASAGITYAALRDGLWQLCFQEGPGAEPRVLRPDLGVDANAPALAPDGSRVAFEVAGQDILVCPLEPAAPCHKVAPRVGSAVRPAWEPRSQELVFVRYLADASGEDSEILITRNGLEKVGPLVTHTGNQDDPDLSPDGRRLVYSSAQVLSLHQSGVRVIRQLWVMDLATGEARTLVPGNHQDIQPDVSPDGRRIAFASNRGGRFEIWTVGADGGGLRQVTSGPGSKTWPAWSPDGRSILFTRAHEGRESLWLVDAEGSDAQPFEPFGPGANVQIRDPDWR